jgi:hypothetical protein
MPFINSVRGSFGPQGRLKNRIGRLGYDTTGGTISESGGYRIHTFTASGASTFRPDSTGSIEIYVWGAGGAAGGTGGSTFCYGGAGAYAYSLVSVTVQDYAVFVGNGGQLGTQGCALGTGGSGGAGYNSQYAGGNGTAAGTTPCSGTGGGGGSASVFFNQAGSPLVVAGGGGGGGGTESVQNGTGQGGGGGQNGNSGTSGAGGAAGASGSTNGGNAVVTGGDHSGSGGGGGGVAGGNPGINPSADGVSGGGGGGGTSTAQSVTNGNYQTPGNTASPFYNSSYAYGGESGQAGGGGLIVIRYPL